MKNFLIIAALMLLSTPALAEVSGNIGFTSQYVFRGISQGPNPAVQASVTAEKNGIYGTFWASQVDFGTEANVEANYMAGVKKSWFDVGYLQYDYYGDDVKLADEAKEVYFGANAGPFSAYVFHDLDLESQYWNLSASHQVKGFDASLFIGHNDEYDHAGVKVGRSFGPVSFGYTFDYVRDASEHSINLFYNF